MPILLILKNTDSGIIAVEGVPVRVKQ